MNNGLSAEGVDNIQPFPLNADELECLLLYGAEDLAILTRRLVNHVKMRVALTLAGGSASVVEFIYGDPLHLFLIILTTAYASYRFDYYKTNDEFSIFCTSEILHRFLFRHPESYQYYIDITRGRYDSIHQLLVVLQSTFADLDSRLHISVGQSDL
jgi:hypothetical protein